MQTNVEAQGGISKRTQHTDISPQTLATALSNADTPLIDAIGVVLNALGYQLLIQPVADEDANLALAAGEPEAAKATAHLSEDPGTSHRMTN